ncbi:MAG: hypothetical protein ACLT3H_05355 [Roseburia sp.]
MENEKRGHFQTLLWEEDALAVYFYEEILIFFEKPVSEKKSL